MIAAELVLPQSTRFEFNYQSFDLLAASSLPSKNFWTFCHPDTPKKAQRRLDVDGVTLTFERRFALYVGLHLNRGLGPFTALK